MGRWVQSNGCVNGRDRRATISRVLCEGVWEVEMALEQQDPKSAILWLLDLALRRRRRHAAWIGHSRLILTKEFRD